jgi:thiamine-monophosphate kinase
MHEFIIINKFLKPLANGSPFALGLTDDAAVLPCIMQEDMVLSTDTLVAGIHFPHQATPTQIAHRSLRTSLSDLAAMGAQPMGYLMNLSLPSGTTEQWLQAYCEGLKADQEHYGIHLLGGDITRAPHDLTITMTVVGMCQKGQAWKRSTASTGDKIYVTGTIGDAYLGLKVLQGNLTGLSKQHQEYLINRYYYPEPRFVAYEGVTAAIDISDGLLQDLGHVCISSSKLAHVEQDLIPLSAAVQVAIASGEVQLLDLLSGGDDYELILAMNSQATPNNRHRERPKDARRSIDSVSGTTSGLLRFARNDDIMLTQIGYFMAETPHQDRVHLVDVTGRRVQVPKSGFTHEI